MILQSDVDIAAHADLVHFCRSRGLRIRKEGCEFVLVDYDSLYISAREPYKWFRHSVGEGGKAIDFCVKFLGLTFHQAVDALLMDFVGRPAEQYFDRQSEQRSDCRRVIAYLCQKRYIDYAIVKSLIKSGKLYQDERGNCVFSVFDFQGNQVGGEIHGTGDSRYKGCLSKHSSFGFMLSDVTTVSSFDRYYLCFFESAIDLISFYQIYQHKMRKNYVLVSMAGLKFSVVRSYVRAYPPMSSVNLFVDNDKSGRMFAKQLVGQLGANVKFPVSGKDWNEYLQILCKNN